MLNRASLQRLAWAVASIAVAAIVVWFVMRKRPAQAPPLPRVTLGGVTRVEGCLACHAAMRGVGPAHAAIGCSPCHLGDPEARGATEAHSGMEVIAGDLATVGRSCGQAACHPVEAARVLGSLMAGAPGILAVDRFAFGERKTPDGEDRDDLRAQGASATTPAEAHARQLCASCHLGAKKEQRGDLGELGRGGGCTACHLAPPHERSDAGGALHPEVSAVIPERRCTGCHARSGRIALSFHGVVELEPDDRRVTGKLRDGRSTGRAPPDVHAKAGMTCLDCHTEREVMGDGTSHRHVHEALDVGCADCHGEPTVAPRDEDREAVAERLRVSWAKRGLPPISSGPPLHTRAGTPLWRTDAEARTLTLVETGARRSLPLASPKPYHTMPGHERLSCQACHSAWAPRCRSCHTRLDPAGTAVDHLSGKTVTGSWVERAGQNDFGPPLLALGPRGRIEPFVEGMTLRIEGAAPQPIDRTLFAPLDPHTTSKARTCASCHAPPQIEDVYPLAGEVTRTEARLLSASERDRIVRVGRCVGCHDTYEDVIWRDFAASVARRPSVRKCKGVP